METKNKMEFGMRIARHSILKEINSGCQKNLVFSPLSLHLSLNLLSSGARGPTSEQLFRFLDFESIAELKAQSSLFMELATTGSGGSGPNSFEENPSCGSGPYSFNRDPFGGSRFNGGPFGSSGSYSSHLNLLRSNGPTISLVNGIWVDQRFPLKHSFKQLAEDVYKVNVQSVDYNQAEQVAHEINAWAREASKGHIDKIVSSDNLKDSILVLASALYFKGSWDQRFDARNTKDEDFRLLNGKRVRVPFMTRRNTFNFYGSFEGFKLLKMEYKNGQDSKKYAMYIFLPDRNDGIKELIQNFHSDPRFLLENHELQNVKLNRLCLPKLKCEYGLDLCDSMKEMGLVLPFGMNAELTEIVDQDSNGNVYVSNAIQKSYIEVNEEGTVATAINSFEMRYGCSPSISIPSELNFVADHPFLFMIKEEISGIVLFAGAALNPLS